VAVDLNAVSTAKPLAWHRRLEAHVVGGVSLVVALSLFAVLGATTRAVTARSLDRASSDLSAARSAFYRLTEDRADFAAAQAGLVAVLPVFRAYITDARLTRDAATIEVMAEDYRRKLQAGFCIVTDRDGHWLGHPGWSAPTNTNTAVSNAIAQAIRGSSSREVALVGDRVFLIVSEPARFAEEVLGTMIVGYPLDDTVARRLAEVTHCEVNLIANGQVVATSLADSARRALSSMAGSTEHLTDAGATPELRRVGTEDYAIGVFPLSPGEKAGAPGRLVLLQNWRPTQDFVDQVQRRVVVTGVAIFFLAIGGGLYISRRMSRPIQDLAQAAGDIASGNWTRQVSIKGSAEAVILARSFNDMTTNLRHWYEEAKRGDDQLRQAQKMEAVGRLAGGVAHDFNNLLTAIKGYGELLLYGLDDDQEVRRSSIEEILKAADRAAGLTRQLLAFGRRTVVTPRVLALDQLVANTQPMLRRLIREDITLTTNLDPNAGPVRADAGQIDQVLVNLVVNASDAMPDGGKLRIEVQNVAFDRAWSGSTPPLPPGSYVRLSVTDTGSGMDRETVTHMFEPFFTTKAEGRGTGLGLATVYAIVEQAGGGIEVDTQLGRGTTFHIYLPEIAGETKPSSAKPDTHSPSKVGTGTVLMVEDDLGVSRLIGSSLRKSGYTVLEAIHGDQALEIVRHHNGPIHLLLTDVVMPGMNGRMLSERVSAIRPETRVLFMSGYSDDAVLRHGVQMASSQFIQKPFSIDELTLKIQEALKLQIAN